MIPKLKVDVWNLVLVGGSPPSWERSVHLLPSTFKPNPQPVSIYLREFFPTRFFGTFSEETLKRVYVLDEAVYVVFCPCIYIDFPFTGG